MLGGRHGRINMFTDALFVRQITREVHSASRRDSMQLYSNHLLAPTMWQYPEHSLECERWPSDYNGA